MMERRKLLRIAAASAGLTLAPACKWGGTVEAATNDRHFMAKAFEMKRLATESGDQPYGAIVVKDGAIVGEGPSRVISNQDPTAHAEMEAIRDAARRLGSRDLGGCTVYATSRPCRMCETAAYWANVRYIYYGDSLDGGGPPTYSSC